MELLAITAIDNNLLHIKEPLLRNITELVIQCVARPTSHVVIFATTPPNGWQFALAETKHNNFGMVRILLLFYFAVDVRAGNRAPTRH